MVRSDHAVRVRVLYLVRHIRNLLNHDPLLPFSWVGSRFPLLQTHFANVKLRNKWSGYLRSTIQIVAALFGWFMATAVAAIYSALCIAASLLLFFLGLAGVWRWWRWRWSEEGRRLSRWERENDGCPVKVMPGEEHGTRWIEARQIANSMNSGMRGETYATHFNLGPFLKCTTGLDMVQLYILISRRDDDEERSKKLDDIDRDREGGWIINHSSACNQ